jgi:hypothetical protein
MALKYSTCLRNKQMGGNVGRHVAAITSTGIAAVDGGAGVDTLTIASGFLAAGFSPGDSILVIGFSGGAAGLVGPFLVSAVTDTTISVPATSLADDAATESVTIVTLVGGSIKDVFKDGVLKIYNGTQPASPDDSLGGATLLVTISKASATFTSGAVAAGLEFGPVALGVLSKITNPADVWSGVIASSGTASWFRFYANAADAGAADTTYIYPRIDGSVRTSGGELNMSSVALVAAATHTVDTFAITLPESA